MGKLAKVFDVTGKTSIDAVLQATATDWDIQTVSPRDSAFSNDGGFRALVRPDTATVLGYVSERYRPNHHRQQLQALDGLVVAGTILPASVSVWDNGAVLAYQFRCPDLDVNVNGNDMVSPLLTLAFAHGFPLADTAFFADFRWFCKNQLGRVAKLTDVRVAHKGDNQVRYAELLTTRMKELKGELSSHYQDMKGLLSKQVTGPKSLAEYFGASLGLTPQAVETAWVDPAGTGPAKQIAEVLDCYLQDDCGAPDTMWQAYNAVTRYQTHNHGRNEATRQRANLLGTGNTVINRALSLAVAA